MANNFLSPEFGGKRADIMSPAGSPTFPLFEENGDREVVMTDKVKNVFEEIQSHKDDCLLENIIRRASVSGESLVAPLETFGDTTQLPQSILEAHDQRQKVQSFVDGLSDGDLSLLNDKGFDGFLAAKIAEMQANKEVKESDGNE